MVIENSRTLLSFSVVTISDIAIEGDHPTVIKWVEIRYIGHHPENSTQQNTNVNSARRQPTT